ncbi:MAG: hypothetical protein HQL73_01215 [Magnetococcales bacterium]|nr:hypothetical protein [Magnetococcales bacterium]
MSTILSSLRKLDARGGTTSQESMPAFADAVAQPPDHAEIDFQRESAMLNARMAQEKRRQTRLRVTLLVLLIGGGAVLQGQALWLKVSGFLEPLSARFPILASLISSSTAALSKPEPSWPASIPAVKGETDPASQPPAGPPLSGAGDPSQSSPQVPAVMETRRIPQESGASSKPQTPALPTSGFSDATVPQTGNGLALDKRLDFLLPPETNDHRPNAGKAKSGSGHAKQPASIHNTASAQGQASPPSVAVPQPTDDPAPPAHRDGGCEAYGKENQPRP